MKNFLNSKSFRLLIAIVVVLIGLLIYTQNSKSNIFSEIISFISSPLNKTSSSAADSIHTAIKTDEEKLKEEIERLQAENQEYRELLTQYYDYKQQAERYKQILNIKEKNTDLTMISASVISRDPLDLYSGFSIDMGELDGVSVGDPVITGDGLVGSVSKVYNTSAYVTTIFSPATHIGANSKDKNETGIIESDIKLSDKGYVKLSYLKTDTQIAAGDIITTTGLSGKFPKNIIVGKVIAVEQNTVDVSKYAYVEPYMDISELSEVFVVTDFYGKGEISAELQNSSAAEE